MGISEQRALELKENPQHLDVGEDNLSLGNIQEKRFSYPLTACERSVHP